MPWTLGLRWHLGCQGPISIPRPDMKTRPKTAGVVIHEILEKWFFEFSGIFTSNSSVCEKWLSEKGAYLTFPPK